MNSYPILTLGGAAVAETPAQPVVAKTGKPTRPLASAAVEVRLAVLGVSEWFVALEEQEIMLTYFAPPPKQRNPPQQFNGWRPEATPLKNNGAGEWGVRLMLRS